MTVGVARAVSLVLCSGGSVLGELPPFPVEVPYWQVVDDVVACCRERFGVEVTVLRILRAPRDARSGGHVSYLAEVDQPPRTRLVPWSGPDPLAAHPLRAAYAGPGGPQDALVWADAALAARGRPLVGPARQMRTWNLAAIWRLPTVAGPAWLKLVPPMFAHEGALVAALRPARVPAVIATHPGRLLMADIPGIDQYAATGPPLVEMLRTMTDLHLAWAGRADQLIAIGVPDRRLPALLPLVEDVAARYAPCMEPEAARRLAALVEGLPLRFAWLIDTGLPETLVHGDFNPGNVRGMPGAFTVLDWGDAFVGRPAMDWIRLHDWIPPADRAVLAPLWARWWAEAVPGSDALRAAELVRPVERLLAAVTYQGFLDRIEPDERVYHEGDPLACLNDAAAPPDA